ncbi:hypothetical protein CW304_33125 [Bacillus sp. UFRGS-B20]|nr:hypothetical protein CW304_33125 [Bacillus sp. UFRGS-B20]
MTFMDPAVVGCRTHATSSGRHKQVLIAAASSYSSGKTRHYRGQRRPPLPPARKLFFMIGPEFHSALSPIKRASDRARNPTTSRTPGQAS